MTSVECKLEIADKKTHRFLVHRKQQVGGSTNQELALNVLIRGVITYYFIKYFQHKTLQNIFKAEKVVDGFLRTFERSFVPNNKEESG